jgi:peptide subunit release factor 1 (eRF1)
MNFNLNSIIATARLALSTVPAQAHAFVERALTIPKSQRDKLYSASGLDATDREEADVLYRKVADAASDWVVFVASKGTIDAD